MNERRIILGHGSTFHDPAIALLEGDNVFAESIERQTQCKRALQIQGFWYSWRSLKQILTSWNLWPVGDAEVTSVSSWSPEALREGLRQMGAKTDNVVESLLSDEKFNPAWAALYSTLEMEPSFVNQLRRLLLNQPVKLRAPERSDVKQTCSAKCIDHHLAHASTAVYTSPFTKCMVMIIDGYGEEGAISFYEFEDNRFQLVSRSTRSLGLLYSAVTERCGFNAWEGEEWKVMGLAAYGAMRPEVYDLFEKRSRVEGLTFHAEFDSEAWALLERLVGGFRSPDDPDIMKAADLAHTFQVWFEDTVGKLARSARERGFSENLALGGGCALNSSANGKLVLRSGFSRLHVPSAPGDDGNALGAALYEKYAVRGEPREPRVMSPYLGSAISEQDVERIVRLSGARYQTFEDTTELCKQVADLLMDGKIIGWAQGRAEFGPRALGNRSILADPRRPDMKDEINRRVKFREQYRPLAPSILHEHGPEYFEDYQESPYMERTLVFREAVRERVPAVVHMDGTGRLQSVRQEYNPLYYKLIRAFHAKSGVPMVLNTSLNVMGKPIVHSAEDAIAVFYTTGLDHLVLGRYVLGK